MEIAKDKTASSEAEEGQHEEVVHVRGLEKTFLDFWGRPKAKAVMGVDFEVRVRSSVCWDPTAPVNPRPSR